MTSSIQLQNVAFPYRPLAKARQVADAGDYVLAPGGVGDFFFVVSGSSVSLHIANEDGDDWVTKEIGQAVGAGDVAYTPADAGDWVSPPTDTAEAADELASRMDTVEGILAGGSGGTLGECRLSRNSTQSLSNSSPGFGSYIQWNTQDYDPNNWWNSGDNTSITPGSTGTYFVTSQYTLSIPASTIGSFAQEIYVDNVQKHYITQTVYQTTGSDQVFSLVVSGLIRITNAAHKIAIMASQGFGTAKNIRGDLANSVTVSVVKLT